MATVYLSLGTNLGERLWNLQQAVQRLGQICTVTAVSPVYHTPPWGVTNQPAFLNLCLQVSTNQTPFSFLTACKTIEQELGRYVTSRWGPRLIDIDLLSYDSLIQQTHNVTLPHPHLHERAFVLVPLADIAPHWRHPITGQTVQQMVADIDKTGITFFAVLPRVMPLSRVREI